MAQKVQNSSNGVEQTLAMVVDNRELEQFEGSKKDVDVTPSLPKSSTEENGSNLQDTSDLLQDLESDSPCPGPSESDIAIASIDAIIAGELMDVDPIKMSNDGQVDSTTESSKKRNCSLDAFVESVPKRANIDNSAEKADVSNTDTQKSTSEIDSDTESKLLQENSDGDASMEETITMSGGRSSRGKKGQPIVSPEPGFSGHIDTKKSGRRSDKKIVGMNALFVLAIAFLSHEVNGYGRMYPNGAVYREVNSTIRIECSAYMNSEGLSIKLINNGPYEPNVEMKILNEKSIEMVIVNAPPQNFMATCYLNKTLVGATTVYVGYKPKPVINFKCISYNWQSMKCTFQRSPNPVASRYELTYNVDNRSLQTNRCPLSGDYNGTYWCTMDFSSLMAVYRQHYRYYYFSLTSKNKLGLLTETFTIDHFGIVIPDPVKNLGVNNITADSAMVQWNIPYQLKTFPRNLTHLLNYTSEFSDGVWKQIFLSSNEILLKDLEFANAWYDVRVSLQVENPLYDNMWSNFTSTTFRTLSRRPDESPWWWYVLYSLIPIFALVVVAVAVAVAVCKKRKQSLRNIVKTINFGTWESESDTNTACINCSDP